ANYEKALWTNYASALLSSIPNPSSPTPESALATYYATVAQIEANQVSVDGTDLVNEVNQVSQEDVALGDQSELAAVNQTSVDDSAALTQLTTLLPEELNAVDNSDSAVVQAVDGEADAEAGYAGSVAEAIAKFYQDKAVASRKYDYATAAAGVAEVGTLAPDYAAYFVQVNSGGQVTENVGADNIAANAAYLSAVQSARQGEISSYGDAEITEAQAIGQAQKDLAKAQGDNEINLATKEETVNNTLEEETVAADETLGQTLDGENVSNAEGGAGEQVSATTIDGGYEVASEHALAIEEVATATQLAQAQAAYAVSMGQIAATAADAVYQQSVTSGSPDATAQFNALYADGYAQWLTDLSPVFVANATAVAQAAAVKEQALVADDVNLADQQAQDNADQIALQEPQSVQQSEEITALDDAYQIEQVANAGQEAIDTAEADKTQKVDLANAGSAYLVDCAEADKQHAIDGFNGASHTDDDYQKALAGAKLTLVDSQADADQAWIVGKSQADETYLTTD
ncbi:MAG TPA: hypothetical protein VGX76_08685, partial [Pirellulales bacterium]|nr:hypothetical protein [Pirellulales bacterium]